jgi:hypothetical protein
MEIMAAHKERAKKIIYSFVLSFKNKVVTDYPSTYDLMMAIYVVLKDDTAVHVTKPVMDLDFFSEQEEKKWYKRHYHICCNLVNSGAI